MEIISRLSSDFIDDIPDLCNYISIVSIVTKHLKGFHDPEGQRNFLPNLIPPPLLFSVVSCSSLTTVTFILCPYSFTGRTTPQSYFWRLTLTFKIVVILWDRRLMIHGTYDSTQIKSKISVKGRERKFCLFTTATYSLSSTDPCLGTCLNSWTLVYFKCLLN